MFCIWRRKVRLRQITLGDCLKLKEWSEDAELKRFIGEMLPFRSDADFKKMGNFENDTTVVPLPL